MSVINDEIKSLLVGGPKYFSEIKKILVTQKKMCANQTLINHLNELESDGFISKTIMENRRTTYQINPKHKGKIKNILEGSAIKLMLETFEDRLIDDDFQIVETKDGKNNLLDWLESHQMINYKNAPKIEYRFISDKESLKNLKYFSRLEEIAEKLRSNIKHEFNDYFETVPPIVDRFDKKQLSNWDSSLEYAEKVGIKHNFRFLMYSYFDGTHYYKKVQSAIKKLISLQQDKENDILFLNEIGFKCYYTQMAYYFETDVLDNTICSEILDQVAFDAIRLSSYWEHLFIRGYNKWDELLYLETAIISEIILKEYPKIPIMQFTSSDEVEKIPFKLIDLSEFVKMKYNALDDDAKNLFLFNSLKNNEKYLKQDLQNLDQFNPLFNFKPFRENPEETLNSIKQNSQFYYEELKIRKYKKNIDSINKEQFIMNFKYKINNELLDLNDSEVVKKFKSFLEDPIERSWLQKCLAVGIPIWRTIPFKQLNFEFQNIL